MVDRRELGTGLRGAARRGLDRQLRVAALGPRALDVLLGGVERGARLARDCSRRSRSATARARSASSASISSRETRLAVGLEAPDLALERANPVGRLERLPGGRRGDRRGVLRRARQPLVG